MSEILRLFLFLFATIFVMVTVFVAVFVAGCRIKDKFFPEKKEKNRNKFYRKEEKVS